jgi:CRISPR-associated protein Csh1
LYEKYKEDFGNYYLLYYQAGEIKDFDFVSKFEFELKDENDAYWQIKNLFEINYVRIIKNVFDLQFAVLLPIFNNALIVKTKAGEFQYRYFDEIDAAYCKSDNTYLLVTTYRKAFYDFIYKSKRQAITKGIFDTILQTGILDDIRLDEYKKGQHSQNISIRQKLNIWFSLSDNFNTNNKPKENMASKLQSHREATRALVKGETSLQSDEGYAFTVGQVIYYLLTKSRTGDRSYKRLEPFLQQVHAKELNKAIARLFDTYKHETFSNNFRNPFAEVMAYETKANMRDLMPTMLAGIFSKNELFSDREEKEADTQPEQDEEQTN